ncbi:WbqC-like protein family protein [Nocardioides exalbidus]|uniref:WbqC-like protein family protein n=1 Tax=Nocardioides exalbidus TaxID=402596 RepID=A0A1H4L9B7_9ACTN|nr:WbqC family protein [Nocardioides exalbidus]SEB67339.1 WbqC-like protein family protein [Nocardioides exalbidus]
MKVTIHQPDLLPYSGFWFKMATCDVFVLSVHDQFQKHGYQRRVTMRGTWCSHQLVGKPSLVPINTVEVAEGWQQRIVDVIHGRYAGAAYFESRGRELTERILASEGSLLHDVNIAMIEIVKDMLDITTPLTVTEPPNEAGTDRLIEQVKMVGGTAYLAGQGGRAYMGDDPEGRFGQEGLELLWSHHQHSTGDSIVTLLMDKPDPMELVLKQTT